MEGDGEYARYGAASWMLSRRSCWVIAGVRLPGCKFKRFNLGFREDERVLTLAKCVITRNGIFRRFFGVDVFFILFLLPKKPL